MWNNDLLQTVSPDGEISDCPTVEFWPQSRYHQKTPSGEGCCIKESLLVSSHPAPCQLVEELLVQLLITLLASHGQEDVSSDELMNNFTISGQTLKQEQMLDWVSGIKSCLPGKWHSYRLQTGSSCALSPSWCSRLSWLNISKFSDDSPRAESSSWSCWSWLPTIPPSSLRGISLQTNWFHTQAVTAKHGWNSFLIPANWDPSRWRETRESSVAVDESFSCEQTWAPRTPQQWSPLSWGWWLELMLGIACSEKPWWN